MADQNDKDNGVLEKEVYEDVKKDVKQIGDNFAKQTEELQKAYKSLKDIVEKEGIEGNREKLEKYREDILTRVGELDSKAAEQKAEIEARLDAIEVASKRHTTQPTEKDVKKLEEAREHIIHCLSVKGETVSDDRLAHAEISVENYDNYVKGFSAFLRKNQELLTPDNLKALSVGIDQDGGYTVTPAMSARILQRMYELDPMRQLASVETISTDSWEELNDTSDVDAGWVSETGTRNTTSSPTLGKKKIMVHEIYAQPKATSQILQDSSINIENWLSRKIADKFARVEGAAFVAGDGVGKPKGILSYANGTSWGQIEQVAMGAAAALTADGFVKIKYALKEQFINTGSWLMNRTAVRDAMLLKDGNGQYIWKPGLIEGDPMSSILAQPVRMATSMPAVAAGALSVAYADFTEAYKIIDRIGITILRDPYTSKPYTLFYTTKRVGGDVVNFDAIKLGVISV